MRTMTDDQIRDYACAEVGCINYRGPGEIYCNWHLRGGVECLRDADAVRKLVLDGLVKDAGE